MGSGGEVTRGLLRWAAAAEAVAEVAVVVGRVADADAAAAAVCGVTCVAEAGTWGMRMRMWRRWRGRSGSARPGRVRWRAGTWADGCCVGTTAGWGRSP